MWLPKKVPNPSTLNIVVWIGNNAEGPILIATFRSTGMVKTKTYNGQNWSILLFKKNNGFIGAQIYFPDKNPHKKKNIGTVKEKIKCKKLLKNNDLIPNE